MTRRTQSVAVFPATGGLQSANNQAIIDPNNLYDMNNIFFGLDQTRKTRPGLKRFDAKANERQNFKFLADFWRYNSVLGGQINKIVRIVNGRYEADNNGDGSFNDITGSLSINAEDNVTADVFSGLLITAFENRTPLKYDHSTLSVLGGSAPTAALYRTHGGYGWLAGVKGSPHDLYRSLADDPNTWSGAGTEIISVSDGDGDPDGIMALFPSLLGDLYVAKRKSIYRVRYSFDLEIFGLTEFVKGVGCISHNSAVAIQNDILFCSERGVHSLSATQKYGDVESSFLSAPIQDVFKREIDFNRSRQISAVFIPEFNSYCLSVPIKGQAANRDMLCYNTLSGQWYRYRGIDISFLATYFDPYKKTRLLAGMNDGRVAYFDDETKLDFGSDPIPSYFKTGIIYAGGGRRTVSFKNLIVFYVPQQDSTFDVSYAIDGQFIETVTFDQSGGEAVELGPDFTLGESLLGQRSIIKIASQALSGNGRGIQLAFNRKQTEGNESAGMEILGYIIEFMDSQDSDEPTVQ